MAIILDNYTVDQQGRFEIDVRYSFDVGVSAETARKKTQHWLQDEISLQLSAQTPTLVVGSNPVWRVPVQLSLPSQGLFPVTSLDVDIVTGNLVDQEAARSQTLKSLEEDVKPRLHSRKWVSKELPPNYLQSLNPTPHHLQR